MKCLLSKRWMLGFFLSLTGSAFGQSAVFYFQAYIEDSQQRPFGIGEEQRITVGCKIYRSENSDAACWHDTFVTMAERGIFEIAIGAQKPLKLQDLIKCAASFGRIVDSLFLEITVNGNVFKPRKRLGASLVALYAQRADSVENLYAGSVSNIHISEDPANKIQASKIDFEKVVVPRAKHAEQASEADHAEIADRAGQATSLVDKVIRDRHVNDKASINHSKINFLGYVPPPPAPGSIIDSHIHSNASIQHSKINFAGFNSPPPADSSILGKHIHSNSISNVHILEKINADKINFANFVVPNAESAASVNGVGVSETPAKNRLLPLDQDIRFPSTVMPRWIDSLAQGKTFEQKLKVKNEVHVQGPVIINSRPGNEGIKDSLILNVDLRTTKSIHSNKEMRVGHEIMLKRQEESRSNLAGLAIYNDTIPEYSGRMEITDVKEGISILGTSGRTINAIGDEGASFNLSDNALTSKYALEVNSRNNPKNSNALSVTGFSSFHGDIQVDTVIIREKLLYKGREVDLSGLASVQANVNVSKPSMMQTAGSAQLLNGKARIQFDSEFSRHLSEQNLPIITVTGNGFAAGVLRIMSRSRESFEVELQPIPGWEAHPTDVTFDWIAVAK